MKAYIFIYIYIHKHTHIHKLSKLFPIRIHIIPHDVGS